MVREEVTDSQAKWKQYTCAVSVSGKEQGTSLDHLLLPSFPMFHPMLLSTRAPITFVLGLPGNSSFGRTLRDPEAQVKSIAPVKKENRVFVGSGRQEREPMARLDSKKKKQRRGHSGRSTQQEAGGHAERICMCVTCLCM